MIKEKLEQEAKDYLRVQTQLNGGGLFSCNVRNLLVGFAESKEKRIEELEKENEILKKANEIIAQQRDDRDRDIAELENQIEKLETQIEKMKCCENCRKEFTKECAWWKRAEENRQINTCKDWEIKE